MDCGYRENVAALQFDHRPGETKLFTLGNTSNLKRANAIIWTEIAKCDVVCANCHAIRTATRRGVIGAAGSVMAKDNPDWAKLRNRRS